jgi:hypothetical protein
MQHSFFVWVPIFLLNLSIRAFSYLVLCFFFFGKVSNPLGCFSLTLLILVIVLSLILVKCEALFIGQPIDLCCLLFYNPDNRIINEGSLPAPDIMLEPTNFELEGWGFIYIYLYSLYTRQQLKYNYVKLRMWYIYEIFVLINVTNSLHRLKYMLQLKIWSLSPGRAIPSKLYPTNTKF